MRLVRHEVYTPSTTPAAQFVSLPEYLRNPWHEELEAMMAKLNLQPKLLLGPEKKELRNLDLDIDQIKVTAPLAGEIEKKPSNK